MEISLESRLIRANRTARTESAAKEDSEKAEIAASDVQPKMDKLTLTRQAIEKLTEQSERLKNLLEREKPEQRFPYLWDMDGEESGNSELDALEEGLKAMRKCQEIARRIMRGDKVPPEDERYLMENDPEGFKLALAMRKPKKNPKEWESVLKDEKKSEQSNSGGEDAAPAASCDASGGASEGGTSDTGGSAE